MKNKLVDLRNHLFATLEALQDETKLMELDRAKAITEVAQTIINSAKVEVEYRRTCGAATDVSDFIEGQVAEVTPKPRLVGGSKS